MSFFDTDRWSEIWQTIARNKKRSIMTALGIFWGIFMLIVMLGAGQGLGRMFRTVLGDMSNNTMFFLPDQTSLPYKGMPADRWWRMENEDVAAVQALDKVKYAAGVVFGNTLNCSRGDRKGDYALMGFSPQMQRIQPQPMIFGRYVNEVDMREKRKVCVIGTQVWKDLFPGGEDPAGQTIKVGSFYFTVVGVILKKGEVQFGSSVERTIILPVTLAQQLFGRGHTVDMISVAGDDATPSKEVEQLCKQTVFARHLISPDDPRAAWVISTSELFGSVMKLFRGIALLTWIVGLGTLFAGIVGVSNIMLVLVKERTQEIGIRRALGAKPSVIISQILSESFLLTFIAGIVGLTAAVGVLSAADTIYYRLQVETMQGPDVAWQISFWTGILALSILVAGSLAAGIIPANRALRIKAVDAIREE